MPSKKLVTMKRVAMTVALLSLMLPLSNAQFPDPRLPQQPAPPAETPVNTPVVPAPAPTTVSRVVVPRPTPLPSAPAPAPVPTVVAPPPVAATPLPPTITPTPVVVQQPTPSTSRTLRTPSVPAATPTSPSTSKPNAPKGDAANKEESLSSGGMPKILKSALIGLGVIFGLVLLCAVGTLIYHKVIKREKEDDDQPFAQRVVATLTRSKSTAKPPVQLQVLENMGPGGYAKLEQDRQMYRQGAGSPFPSPGLMRSPTVINSPGGMYPPPPFDSSADVYHMYADTLAHPQPPTQPQSYFPHQQQHGQHPQGGINTSFTSSAGSSTSHPRSPQFPTYDAPPYSSGGNPWADQQQPHSSQPHYAPVASSHLTRSNTMPGSQYPPPYPPQQPGLARSPSSPMSRGGQQQGYYPPPPPVPTQLHAPTRQASRGHGDRYAMPPRSPSSPRSPGY
ncbi:hypothetical protein DFS34DRAFT_631404 [Phlyctochytrium arcticum]|nr:hypothetical protein DFS34DRAFT_631404 [Phlyctochytrium arcticum]